MMERFTLKGGKAILLDNARAKLIHDAFASKAKPTSVARDRTAERRSKTENMNSSERRFYNECLAHDEDHEIHIQPQKWFSLRGPGNNTYTPDFLEIDHAEGVVRVHEVKGGYRGPGWEQGYERYKRAACQYDHGIVEFWMHELIKGKWKHIRFRETD